MEKFLNKKYKLDKCENLDEFLMEMGMNSITRKIAKTLTTTLQLTKKSDGTYSLNSTILVFSTSQKFTLGVGKDLTTTDGRKVNNIFYIEGNKLIEKQIGERTLIIEREFFDDHLIAKATFSDSNIICTSVCKALPD
ncbi:hypothetical protein PVAND_011332 [Polypedilum vanderplanki]|uniref:Lipocalin/cytosolic fatty-acid binding domain-containing protein n=1 Tax=Polypedilum vanderplanki TaxID=319348 RepID=A0A9J6CI80_POLVA|nr:hypothetical protein PVAND_011332 [Polypedilum vanderplanki]